MNWGMQLVAEGAETERTGCIPEGKTIVIVYRDIIIPSRFRKMNFWNTLGKIEQQIRIRF